MPGQTQRVVRFVGGEGRDVPWREGWGSQSGAFMEGGDGNHWYNEGGSTCPSGRPGCRTADYRVRWVLPPRDVRKTSAPNPHLRGIKHNWVISVREGAKTAASHRTGGYERPSGRTCCGGRRWCRRNAKVMTGRTARLLARQAEDPTVLLSQGSCSRRRTAYRVGSTICGHVHHAPRRRGCDGEDRAGAHGAQLRDDDLGRLHSRGPEGHEGDGGTGGGAYPLLTTGTFAHGDACVYRRMVV